MTQQWDAALAAYRAARAEHEAYYQSYWLPAHEAEKAGGPPVPQPIADKIERLMDVTSACESALMVIPSPHSMAFATKYLIAHGDGREAEAWDDMLEVEAKRFAANQCWIEATDGRRRSVEDLPLIDEFTSQARRARAMLRALEAALGNQHGADDIDLFATLALAAADACVTAITEFNTGRRAA